jgi:hypothetical protein
MAHNIDHGPSPKPRRNGRRFTAITPRITARRATATLENPLRVPTPIALR